MELAMLLVGLIAGALGAWLLMRSRQHTAVELALAHARAESQAQLIALTARAEHAEGAQRQQGEELRVLRGRAEALQGVLDQLRGEAAQLRERATRVERLESELQDLRLQLQDEQDTRQRLAAAEAEQAQRALQLDAQLQETKAAHERADAEARRCAAEARGLAEQLDAERRGAAEKLALLTSAREALTDQFKALAADILEEKSRRFAEQNQASLGQLLDPLRTRLAEFQRKVEEVYVTEGKERSALAQQVRQLAELNQVLSAEAKNLTSALKGSAKSQGNWGELVLERVLEAAGLRKGHEYVTQDSRVGADGQRLQPDVVIHLPEERRLVVDAKVSLVAYERYANAEGDAGRSAALRQHLDSVRAHLRGLSDKHYQQLYGLQSLDFVLMFMPVEPAFMLAVTHDGELFMDAWRRNVLLVSPSTLLFVLRTVSHLWRQEAQNRNAQEIARRGAELYDRLCGFATELKRAGEALRAAQRCFDDAEKKLASGRGNVIRQAEMLKELGIKPARQLPQHLTERAEADEAAGVALARAVAAIEAGAVGPGHAAGNA
jgi:DNA recombination protein RmuC